MGFGELLTSEFIWRELSIYAIMNYGAADKEGQIVGTRGWTRGSVRWTRVFGNNVILQVA
jgi:hypothetical protein